MKLSLFPLLLLLLTSTVARSFPTMKEPEFAKLIEAPDELPFTIRFCEILLEIPAAELPAFRSSFLEACLKKEPIPRRCALAIELIDSHWAEIDPLAYTTACINGLEEANYRARNAAAIALLDIDEDAAIKTVMALELHPETVATFAASLANKNLNRALVFYKQQAADANTYFTPRGILTQWARTDAQAAWDSIVVLPYPNSDKPRWMIEMQTATAASIAHRDPATARRLIETLTDPKIKNTMIQNIVSKIAADSRPQAIAICREWDAAPAWRGLVRSLKAANGEEIFRILHETIPPANRQEAIIDFFTYQGNGTVPSFPNARYLALVDDKALRRELIIAIAKAKTNAHISIPDAVTTTAISLLPDLLSAPTPEEVSLVILRSILTNDPLTLLPWITTCSGAEWVTYRDEIYRNWPNQRYAQDIPILMAHAHTRVNDVGKNFLHSWLWYRPSEESFTAMARHAPEAIVKSLHFGRLAKELAGDTGKVDALIQQITDPIIRTEVSREWAKEKLALLPPEQGLESVREQLANARGAERMGLLTIIAQRPQPSLDESLFALPDLSAKDRDTIRDARAKFLMQSKEEVRCLKMLAAFESDAAFFECLYYLPNEGDISLTRWDEFLALLASREEKSMKNSVIEKYARKLVTDQKSSALAICNRIDEENFRKTFTDEVKRILPPNKQDLTWENALKLGLGTPQGRDLGMQAITLMAQNDPKAAIALLLQTDDAALRSEFLQPIAKQIIARDPAAAFALLRTLPPDIADSFISSALSAWARYDLPAACEASLEVIDAFRYHSDPGYAKRWFNKDPAAATEWALSKPPGRARQRAIGYYIVHLSNYAPEQAVALFHKEYTAPLPEWVSHQLAEQLSQNSYEMACQFIRDLDGKIAASTFQSNWNQILRFWYASDAEKALAFIHALPVTHYANQLRQFWSKPPLASEISEELQKPTDISALCNAIRQGNLAGKMLSTEEIAAILKLILEDPSIAHGATLTDLCLYFIRTRRHDDIIAVLRAGCERSRAKGEAAPYEAERAVSGCINHYEIEDPERIPALLQTIAKEVPELLESATLNLWQENPNTTLRRSHISGLQAETLLHFSAPQRAKILSQVISNSAFVPTPFVKYFTDPQAASAYQTMPIIQALIRNDLPQALQAAAPIDGAEMDAILCGILATFPSSEAAAAAIKTLPENHRTRVEAWWASLQFGK